MRDPIEIILLVKQTPCTVEVRHFELCSRSRTSREKDKIMSAPIGDNRFHNIYTYVLDLINIPQLFQDHLQIVPE